MFWVLSVAHVAGAGTDGRSAWLLAPVAVTVAIAAWLLADRWLSEPRPRPPAPAAQGQAAPVSRPPARAAS